MKGLRKLFFKLTDFDVADYLWIILGALILSVLILKVSILLMPPKYIDLTWTSHSITGWTNTPKKLAWARVIGEVSGEKQER